MKVSFITTVFNEEKTIALYLASLFQQTRLPDEIIIVDGGSRDKTVKVITDFKKQVSKKYKKPVVQLSVKSGNRSVGRNEAIKRSTGDIIVCSDSGNELDAHWIENITKPFSDKTVDVVAGYYRGKAQTLFQKCLIPYALVMPDKVNPKEFLPATRSVAFTKSIWAKAGKFDEKLSHNEDYVFARKLKSIGAKIVFAKNAVVDWLPRRTYKGAFVMFYRFALGDAEAGVARSNVLLLFARYIVGFYLLFLCLLYRSFIGVGVLLLLLIIYFLWAIKKNYRYVKDIRAIFILPLIQLTADAAVLLGSMYGVWKKAKQHQKLNYVKQNKSLFFALAAYFLLLAWISNWGIPNSFHPFPYHMDEWHQLHAVATTFKEGTPNTEGSANGTILSFLLSGFYLVPFFAMQYITPASFTIDNLLGREQIFQVLRFETILFGLLSIWIFYLLVDKLKLSKKLALFLFICNPLWLMISGYFKYDIVLLFFIILSLLFSIRYAKNPTNTNFLISAIPASLAIAVKISAIPLFLVYCLSYFLFTQSWKKNFNYFLLGVGIFIMSMVLFGMPDTLFGKGNILLYFYENVVTGPGTSSNYNLSLPPLIYLFIKHYPLVFGYGLMIVFLISLLFLVIFLAKQFLRKALAKYKIELFFLLAFTLFALSIFPLLLLGGGNRSLVLLPFIVCIILIAYKRIATTTMMKQTVIVCIVIICCLQLYQTFSWFYIKLPASPQQSSSAWIQKNIKQGSEIGLENIPIYQLLPDILQKEFYFIQYNVNYDPLYKYKIVDASTKKLPEFIVITNADIEVKLLKDSPKKQLVTRIQKEGYKKIAEFSPELRFYKTFGSDIDYYLSGMLVASPLTISIYKR